MNLDIIRYKFLTAGKIYFQLLIHIHRDDIPGEHSIVVTQKTVWEQHTDINVGLHLLKIYFPQAIM
jgi:hypothetical protein